jgi:hypothetical protein
MYMYIYIYMLVLFHTGAFGAIRIQMDPYVGILHITHSLYLGQLNPYRKDASVVLGVEYIIRNHVGVGVSDGDSRRSFQHLIPRRPGAT